MNIFIKKLDGSTVEVSVCGTDTLDSLRRKVISMLALGSVSLGQVQLIFRGNLIEGLVGDHGIGEGSELIVVIKERQFIQITIENDRKRIPLEVESCETLENVKSMLAEREGYSANEQQLFFNGRELSGDRLSHHEISQGSVLQLRLRAIQIFVKDFNGKSHTFQVRSSDTVDHLRSLVQQQTGVTPSQQVLTHEGRQLQSGNRLSAYNIRENSTLHLTGRLRGG